jgi:hypothetical protein
MSEGLWLVVTGAVGFLSYFIGGMAPEREGSSLVYRNGGCVIPSVCLVLIVIGLALVFA